MNREVLKNECITLAFFWSPIVLAWLLALYHLGPDPGAAMWICLAAILGLLLASLARALATAKAAGPEDPLPWYLLVGLRGAGKTTLLMTSGLRPSAIPGDDSFLAHRSIILEGTGGYLLDDSLDADDDTRAAFLADLQEFLRTKRLDGIIAAVEVSAASDGPGSLRLAALFRDHLDDLTTRLGLRLPLYLAITKCDLIAGFLPFFANLTPAARSGCWGAALPSGRGNGQLAGFERECAILASALDERQLASMTPDDTAANRLSYLFPARFESAYRGLAGFVGALFAGSPGPENLIFRGCYWTSAKQPPAPAKSHSYFVRDLLARVLPADTRLAGATPGTIRRRWGQRVLLSLIAFVPASALIILVHLSG